MDQEQLLDNMLREQVVHIATAILANEERIASETDIRKHLGGGDLARIAAHKHAWVKRAIQVFRHASDDFALMSGNDGLSEALLHIKVVREEAIESAQLAAQVFADDLQALSDEVQKVRNEGAELVLKIRQFLGDLPDLERTLAELRTERVALTELLNGERGMLEAISVHLQTERSRVAEEWEDLRHLTELVQKGQKSLKGRLRSLLKDSDDLGSYVGGPRRPGSRD